jgi:uncharacterized protein (DUF1684 family)
MLPNANPINSAKTREYNKERYMVIDNEWRIKERKEEKNPEQSR